MIKNTLPSAFQPDMPAQSSTHAPSSVSRITAQVLGTLIANQVLKLQDQPGETIEYVDRLIAAAVDAAIEWIDVAEVSNAVDARDQQQSAQADNRTERLSGDESVLIARYRTAVKLNGGKDLTPDQFAFWLMTDTDASIGE